MHATPGPAWSIDERRDAVWLTPARARLHFEAVVDIEAELERIQERHPQALVLDLRHVEWLDPSAIRLVLRADARARAAGARLIVVADPLGPVGAALGPARGRTSLELVDDASEALLSFRPPPVVRSSRLPVWAHGARANGAA